MKNLKKILFLFIISLFGLTQFAAFAPRAYALALGDGDPEIRDQAEHVFIFALATLALLAVIAIVIATIIHAIRKHKKVKILFWVGIVGMLLITIGWTLMSYFDVVFVDDSDYAWLIGLVGIDLILILVIWLIIRTVIKALIRRHNKPRDKQQQTPKPSSPETKPPSAQ